MDTRDKNKKHLSHIIRIALCATVITALLVVSATEPSEVYAAEAEVYFGSEGYESESGDSFRVGVYIDAGTRIGTYRVELEFDELRLDCTDGADEVDSENGILVLTGEANNRREQRMLTFETKSGGTAKISVRSADVRTEADEDENFDVTRMESVEVVIEGDDTAEEIEKEKAQAIAEAEEKQVEEAKRKAEEEKESSETDDDNEKKSSIFFNSYVVIIVVFIFLLVIVELTVLAVLRIVRKKKRRKERLRRLEERRRAREGVGVPEAARTSAMRPAIVDEEKERKLHKELGDPVITVDDVTMTFKLYSNQPSGLKDYIIANLSRKISYKRLYALYHVSFNVYRGEVVGIIGTNGSGKSTLLKIVSGAMKPTGGRVDVDRSKVQLLTLGTGFDMELTAKENVYLNGAIIGYSKEFLDEHYDEIVEFAELENFMDEKVKNFSSGMVSRLGFAIATVGDAAEILILDEVLSVGDEFFRKKSLARIKEMIHGGSTVLMVSHGMGTILDNCSKCVWIEKGRLMMVGKPKTVCEAYRKMEEE